MSRNDAIGRTASSSRNNRRPSSSARKQSQNVLFPAEAAKLRGNLKTLKAVELCRSSAELIQKSKTLWDGREESGRDIVPLDWNHLRHNTEQARLTFLQVEIGAGLTFARIALTTRDRKKSLRNARNAQAAYKTVVSHVDRLSDGEPGVPEIREKLVALRQLLSLLGPEDSLENRVEPG